MSPLIDDSETSNSSWWNREYVPKTSSQHETTTVGGGAERRVSFVPLVKVFHVLSHVDYTDEELRSSWFDTDEMEQMKRNARTEADLVDSGILQRDTDFVAVRGIECRTREGIRRKKKHRKNAYAAVFFELECQIEDGVFDDDMLREAYEMYSETCAFLAHTVGKQDEAEALKINGVRKVDFPGPNFRKPIIAIAPRRALTSSAA